jgi:hypothetical protein
MICFYSEELLASHPTTKLEDHPLSAVRDCLFNISAATLHTGSRSSIRNLRMHHAGEMEKKDVPCKMKKKIKYTYC